MTLKRISTRACNGLLIAGALALLVGCGGESKSPAEGTTPSTQPAAVPSAAEGEAVAADEAADKTADEAADKTAEAAEAAEAAKTGATDPGKAAEPAAAEEASGPCADFTKKVCDAAGEQSPSCSALGVATKFLSDRACTVAIEDLGDISAKLADMKKVCTDLANKLCKDVGEDTKSCAMVQEKTPDFPPERCEQMMGQYDQVLAELQRMEKMNQPVSDELKKKIAASDAPAWGPADAKVTLVEFSDFECPYCSKAAEAEQQLKEKYSDKVRFVFRQFPLSFHKNAMPAAIASLEAHKQGKFWEVHDALFAQQRDLTRENIEKIGETAGMDMTALKAALDGNTYEAIVNADIELAKEVGVQGTPTLFLNGERVQNPSDFESIAKAIDEALAK